MALFFKIAIKSFSPQVYINYPFGKQKKMVKDCANITKCLARRLNKAAVKTAIKNTALAGELIDLELELIDNECKSLSRNDSGSILRCTNPADPVELKMENLKKESSQKTPLLSKLLTRIYK